MGYKKYTRLLLLKDREAHEQDREYLSKSIGKAGERQQTTHRRPPPQREMSLPAPFKDIDHRPQQAHVDSQAKQRAKAEGVTKYER